MYFETENLSVGYSGKTLIHDINIAVEKAKILTLIGPNGSGKSTILKTITKHLEKIGGVITIENQNMAKLSNKELAKRMSVMLTERIDPELMTCEQVVAMGRYPYTNYFGGLTEEDRRVVRESLVMVRAEGLAERPFPILVTDSASESCLQELFVRTRKSLFWMSRPLILTFATRLSC